MNTEIVERKSGWVCAVWEILLDLLKRSKTHSVTWLNLIYVCVCALRRVVLYMFEPSSFTFVCVWGVHIFVFNRLYMISYSVGTWWWPIVRIASSYIKASAIQFQRWNWEYIFGVYGKEEQEFFFLDLMTVGLLAVRTAVSSHYSNV